MTTKRLPYFLLAGLLLVSSTLLGQDTIRPKLTFDEFFDIVRNHHPLAKQTEIVVLKGDAAVLKAKGGFDPKIFSDLSQKYFDAKRYYNISNSGVKFPTNLGFEVQTGFESNSGIFLNPENNVPSNGLWYAGVSVPLGKGLLIDERRAGLRKAKLYMESTEFERRLLLNEMFFEAGKAYWNWFTSYHILEIYRDAERVAIERFNGVRQSAILGDRAAIDTLEAGIQVQNRQLSLRQAEIDYQKAKAIVSAYLWAEGIVPVELDDDTAPLGLEDVEIEEMDDQTLNNIQQLILNHPKLQLYQYKIRDLEVDQRLKREQLKPEINLKLNAITTPLNGEVFTENNSENYTLGVNFQFPLLLRKERGDVRLARLKLSETQYEFQADQAQYLAKAVGALNEWSITRDQVELYNRTVNDYRLLFNGEQRLFQSGESSLFMVNSRESGYINAQVKSVEIKGKNLKARLMADYALGILN